ACEPGPRSSGGPGGGVRPVSSTRRVVVEADGGSRGNPGPAGYGAVVRDAETGEVLAERAEAIGIATNNVAEYRGLIAGLQAAAAVRPAVGWGRPAGVPTSLLLLRHAETAHSADLRFSGRNDLPLTAHGVAQAEAAATRLGARRGAVAAVLTSPLPRARITAR